MSKPVDPEDDALIRVLRDPRIWESGEPEESLRPLWLKLDSLLEAMDSEFDAAGELCGQILTGPPHGWPERMRRTPRVRTFGMVRQLLSRIPAFLDSDPAAALQLTSLAMAVAEALKPDDDGDHMDRVPQARGLALHDHALVLSYLGRHKEALVHVERAAGQFGMTSSADLHGARLSLLKACILYALNRPAESLPLARAANEVFATYDFGELSHVARLTEAAALHAVGAVEQARGIRNSMDAEADGYTASAERRLYERYVRVGEGE